MAQEYMPALTFKNIAMVVAIILVMFIIYHLAFAESLAVMPAASNRLFGIVPRMGAGVKQTNSRTY